MGTQQVRKTDSIVRFAWTDSRALFAESLALLIVIWYFFAHVVGLSETVSTPAIVATETYALFISFEWIEHLITTGIRVLAGFAVSMLVGTVLGLMLGLSDFWKVALKDWVLIGLALPSLMVVVFSAMWFGFSIGTPIASATLIAFPFVTQSIYEGIDDIDAGLYSMSEAFNISKRRVTRRIVIPAVAGEWFAGARFAFAASWKLVTLAELFVANSGFGFMIQYQVRQLSLSGILSWVLIFTTIMLLIEYGVFQQIEKRVFAWRQSSDVGFIAH